MRASSRTDANVEVATTFASARESALKALQSDEPVHQQSPLRHYASEVRAVGSRTCALSACSASIRLITDAAEQQGRRSCFVGSQTLHMTCNGKVTVCFSSCSCAIWTRHFARRRLP